jgi:hypothetical protein
VSPEGSRPHPGAIAANDQMRAEARDRLRDAPLFVASIGDEDGHRVLGSLWAPEDATLGFLFATVASVWEWVAEVTSESDAELVRRLMFTLAARRDDVDDDGGDAGQE